MIATNRALKTTQSRGPHGEVETVLVGRLTDQAALSGVLNTLYELHMPVLSIQRTECDENTRALCEGNRFIRDAQEALDRLKAESGLEIPIHVD